MRLCNFLKTKEQIPYFTNDSIDDRIEFISNKTHLCSIEDTLGFVATTLGLYLKFELLFECGQKSNIIYSISVIILSY